VNTGAAYEEEIRRALVPLAAAFDAWRAGTITSGALTMREWVSIGISRMPS